MSKIVQVVKTAFREHPIIANSLVYGTFFIGAEFSQQTVSRKLATDKPVAYDTAVLKKYAFYGPLVQGPLIASWYRWLDKKLVGTSVNIVTRKILADQFIFTPVLLIVFFVSMGIMERKEDVFEECKQKLIPTFKTSCMFWLPAQIVNFFFIPPVFRVAYVGACSFAWVNILCYIKRQ